MPRPRKTKNVYFMPRHLEFGPGSSNEFVFLSLEEFETIRLIDLEGFNQEECAKSMGSTRTTIQNIYSNARLKIADSIVNGKTIKIGGGNIRFCNNPNRQNKKDSN